MKTGLLLTTDSLKPSQELLVVRTFTILRMSSKVRPTEFSKQRRKPGRVKLKRVTWRREQANEDPVVVDYLDVLIANSLQIEDQFLERAVLRTALNLFELTRYVFPRNNF
jgi:hypothetical protein